MTDPPSRNAKPRKPLKRTALARPIYEQVIAAEQRRRAKAKPIARGKVPKRIGRRGLRLEASWRKCKAKVKLRSGGFCEGNIAGVCPPWQHGASDVHHVWPEDRASGRHNPSRCLHLCRTVHDWCDAEPDLARDAGILRPRSGMVGWSVSSLASRGARAGIVSEG